MPPPTHDPFFDFVDDLQRLSPSAASAAITRAQVEAPISPDEVFTAASLCDDARVPGRKRYLPTYKVATRAASGQERVAVQLKGDTLSVELTRSPPPAAEAVEMVHSVAVAIVRGAGVECVQRCEERADGLALTLKTGDRNLLFHALSEESGTRLRIRRRTRVASPVDRSEELRQLETARAARRDAAANARQSTQGAERELSSARAAVASADAAVVAANARCNALTARIADLREQVSTLPRRVEELQRELAALRADFARSHHRPPLYRPPPDPDDPENDPVSPQEIAATMRELSSAERRLANARAALPGAEAELGPAQAAVAQQVAAAVPARARVEELQRRSSALEAEAAAVEREVADLSARVDAARVPTFREADVVLDVEVPFFFPNELHPYIYRDLEEVFVRDRWTELDGPPEYGRTLYVRRGEHPWLFYVLPTSFRLAFQTEEGLPRFKPVVYADPAAGTSPEPKDMRVRLLLEAVPQIAPDVRRYLHEHLAQVAEQPFVRLRYGAAFEHAEYREEIGPATSAGRAEPLLKPMVDVSGFALEYHLRLEDYVLLVKEQLGRSGSALRGHVFVTLKVAQEVRQPAIEVRLSFDDLDLDNIEARRTRAPEEPGRLSLRNPTSLKLTVGELSAYALRTTREGELAEVRRAQVGVELPLTLGPHQTLLAPLSMPDGASASAWNDFEVEVGGVRAPDFTPQQWLDRIHRAADLAAVYKPVSVTVVNLVRAHRDDDTLVGVKVVLNRGRAEPLDRLILPEAPMWSTHVLRTLSQLLGDDPDDSYSLLFWSVYQDGSEGVAQRARTRDNFPVLTALARERADSRYAVAASDGGPALAQDLSASAAREVTRRLEAADRTWSLRVTAPATPGEGEGRFDVYTALLDFSDARRLQYVILKLRSGAGSTSFTLNAAAPAPIVWKPITRAPQVEHEAMYIFSDRPPQVVRGQTDATFLVLVAP